MIHTHTRFPLPSALLFFSLYIIYCTEVLDGITVCVLIPAVEFINIGACWCVWAEGWDFVIDFLE